MMAGDGALVGTGCDRAEASMALASRLRPLSSKATHPPNYRSLHSGDGGRDGEGNTSRLVGVEK